MTATSFSQQRFPAIESNSTEQKHTFLHETTHPHLTTSLATFASPNQHSAILSKRKETDDAKGHSKCRKLSEELDCLVPREHQNRAPTASKNKGVEQHLLEDAVILVPINLTLGLRVHLKMKYNNHTNIQYTRLDSLPKNQLLIISPCCVPLS